jgi:hypothetical protein
MNKVTVYGHSAKTASCGCCEDYSDEQTSKLFEELPLPLKNAELDREGWVKEAHLVEDELLPFFDELPEYVRAVFVETFTKSS